MPIVSEFYGIKIIFYWNDHYPPHFHAEYSEYKILVDIEKATVIKGIFPFKQLKLVLAWCEIHKNELRDNWENAQQYKQIKKIEPLI